MSDIDWSPIVQAAGVLMTSVVIPWGIMAYQRRTGVQLDDQQRAAVYSALNTAAGILRTKLDQGHLKVADITAGNPAIMAEAKAALARVPDSAEAQGTTVAAASQILVGKVDTSPVARNS